jgi:hypothetical protein
MLFNKLLDYCINCFNCRKVTWYNWNSNKSLVAKDDFKKLRTLKTASIQAVLKTP